MIPFPQDVRDPQFAFKIGWWSNQQKQDQANKDVHDAYVRYSTDWIASATHAIQSSLSPTQPQAVPVMTVYNDDFTISHPSFPDLKIPTIDPAQITVAPVGFAGINPTGQTADSNATLIMLQHIIQELDAIRAKLGVS